MHKAAICLTLQGAKVVFLDAEAIGIAKGERTTRTSKPLAPQKNDRESGEGT